MRPAVAGLARRLAAAAYQCTRALLPRRTRRSWKPNAVRKRVFSELLGRMLPLNLTTHTLRCIDKAGGAGAAQRSAQGLRVDVRRSAETRPSRAGLDAYVLNARDKELGTGVGPELRHALLFAAHVRHAEAQEAAAAAADAPRKAE